MWQQAPHRSQSSQDGSAAAVDRNSDSASLASKSSSETSDSRTWTGEEEDEDEDEDEDEQQEEEAALAGPARRRQSTSAGQQWTGQYAHGGATQTAAAITSESGLLQQAPAPASAGQHTQHTLHQPYSNLLLCESHLGLNTLYLSRQLCTDLAELHSEGSCAVQVSVVVHPTGWGDSQECRDYIQQQQHPNAAQQQHAANSQIDGPFEATLRQYVSGRLQVTGLRHDGKLKPYFQPGNPHTLVLQQRVSSRAAVRDAPACAA
jgi:hypothetical protein